MPMMKTIWLSMPWLDARGRFSWFKASVLIILCLPALWMAQGFWSGNWDFPSPYVPLIYHSGLWTTYVLLASLAVTPLRKILNWASLIQIRRMLGIACFVYALLHVLAWFGLRYWDVNSLLKETLERPTLWVATVAFLVLLALTATSLDGAVRAMGGLRWRRLHSLVYAATLLAVVHFLLSPGSLQGAPFLMAGAYIWLMGWRALDRRRLGSSQKALLALAVGCAVTTLALQPIWLTLFQTNPNRVNPWTTTWSTFDVSLWEYFGVPPSLTILAWGLITVCAPAFSRYRTRS